MADLWPGRPNFKLEGPDLRPDGPDLRLDGPDGEERTNKGTKERKYPCVLQDFVPFGAAAQKTMMQYTLFM